MPAFPGDLFARRPENPLRRVCNDFHSAWLSGHRPRIETYLEQFEGESREQILRELLLIELDHHRTSGQAAGQEDYVARFPDFEPLVREVFREVIEGGESTRPASPQESTASFRPQAIEDTGKRISGAEKLKDDPRSPGVAASGEPLQLPCQFGNYELLEELGHGGMGVVYRARHLSADRIVALKIIRPDQLSRYLPDQRTNVLARFRTEVQASARLEHDHVIPVYDVGEEAGHSYYTMPFVSGKSLRDIVQEGPLDAQQAAGYTRQIAMALQHAHAHGILHRDVKPHNVMVHGVTGRAQLMDFGLAKLAEGDSQLTGTNVVLGTPAYMAPEQTLGSREVTSSADIYGLGAMLYHLLTGRAPFQASDQLATMLLVQNETPLSPRKLNPLVPRDLETICLKCLEKEPPRRYGSAQELAEDLRRFLEGEPIHARPVSAATRLIRWCRREPRTAAMAATVLLTITIGLAGISWQWRRAEQNLQLMIKERNAAKSARNLAEQRQEEAELHAAKAMSESRKVVAQNIVQNLPDVQRDDPELALLLMAEVMELFQQAGEAPESTAHDALESLLVQSSSRPLVVHPGGLQEATFGAENQWVATLDKERTARVWSNRDRDTSPPIISEGTQGSIAAFAASPGGNWMAAAYDGGRIWLKHLQEPHQTIWLDGHNDRADALAFSHDGKWLASGGRDQRVLVWSLDRLPVPDPIELDADSLLSCITFSPNDQYLVAADRGGALRVWQVAELSRSPEPLLTQRDHGDVIQTIAVSPDNRWITSGGADQTIRLLDLEQTERKIAAVAAHKVDKLWFVNDGRFLLTLEGDYKRSSLRIWMLQSDAPLSESRLLEEDVKLSTLSLSPDGRWVAYGKKNTVQLWDLAAPMTREGKAPHVLSGFTKEVSVTAFHPDGNHVVAGEVEPGLRVWQLDDLMKEPRKLEMQGRLPQHIAFDDEGDWMAVGNGRGKRPELIEFGSGKPAPQRMTTGINTEALTDLIFLSGGRFLAAASSDAVVLSSPFGDPHLNETRSADWVTCFAFHPHLPYWVVGKEDGSVSLYHLNDPGSPRLVHRHPHSVYDLSFTPDGRWLVSSGIQDRFILFRLTPEGSVAEKVALEHPAAAAPRVITEPNSRWLVLYTDPVGICDLAAEDPADATVSLGGFGSAKFSPDGRLLFAPIGNSRQQLLRLGRITTQATRQAPLSQILAQVSVPLHGSSAGKVEFSQNSRWLAATGVVQKPIYLWQTQRMEKGSEPVQLPDSVGSWDRFRFLLEGRLLGAFENYPGKMRFWDIGTGEPRRWQLSDTTGANKFQTAYFSPNGRWVVTSPNRDNAPLEEVALWELNRRRAFALQHPQWVRPVSFSPDGRWLATGGGDLKLRLTQLQEGRSALHTITFDMHMSGDPRDTGSFVVHPYLKFSQDSRWLLSADNAGRAVARRIPSASDTTSTLSALARQLAGRELTAAERSQFFLDDLQATN